MAKVKESPTDAGMPPLLPAPTAATKQEQWRPTGTPSDEQLHNLLRIWRAQRQEYPGWIVTPTENRDDLWMRTADWIQPVLDAATKFTAPENLYFCYELNWRLERTLTPLFLPWVESIAKVVESFAPFPSDRQDAPTTATSYRVDAPEHASLPWAVIQEQWSELVFALAREAREDQDLGRFNHWMTLVEVSLPEDTERLARWHHEKCLFFLGSFDLVGLRVELEKWPQVPALPMWEARRAAILAELGDLKEAERIAQTALTVVRSRLRPFANDYQVLSQEGWIMLLLGALASNRLESKTAARNRFEKLGVYRCNPWDELKYLSAVLAGEMPRPKPFEQIRASFDPRSRIISSHWGQTPPHYMVRPAFAMLRLYEDGALPLRCGNVTIQLDEAVSAARWIEPYAPLWSINYRIRADKYDDLESHFTRASVAGLGEKQVENLYRIILQPLRQAASSGWLKGIEANYVLGFRLLDPLLHLLSKLFLKLDGQEQDEVFNLLLWMYQLPVFRENEIVGEKLIDPFERVLAALPQEKIIAHMTELLALPIPGEGGFAVAQPRRWPEPLTGFKPDRRKWERESYDRSAWDSPIRNLIRIVKEGGKEARSRACSRLQALVLLGALTPAEHADFGDALWSRLSPSDGLPTDTFLHRVSLLRLPSPEPGRTRELLKKYFLGREFPAVSSTSADDGDEDFAVTLRDITLQPLAPPEHADIFIDWTFDEAVGFLQKATAWWQKHQSLVLRDASRVRQQRDQPAERASELVDVLAVVIMPRLPVASEEIKQQALDLLNEIGAADIRTLRATAFSLIIAPERSEDLAKKLGETLLLDDEETLWNALVALGNWALLFAKGSTVVAPPAYLLNELTGRILHRVPTSLDLVIDTADRVCRRAGDLIEDEMVEALLQALERLLVETQYPNSATPEYFYARERERILPEHRPECRRSAGRLASTLHHRFIDHGQDVPVVLEQWRHVCATDPLPEVRRAWSAEDES